MRQIRANYYELFSPAPAVVSTVLGHCTAGSGTSVDGDVIDASDIAYKL